MGRRIFEAFFQGTMDATGPPGHPVRRRRLPRALCRAGPVPHRVPGSGSPAQPGGRHFLKPLAGSARSSSSPPTSATRMVRAASAAATRWSTCRRAEGRFPGHPCRRARIRRRGRRGRGASALVHVSAIGADPASESRYYRTRAKARRRCAPPSRPRRSFAPRCCSGARTISSTASPALARLAPVLPVVSGRDEVPARLRRRRRPRDRRRGARPANSWRPHLRARRAAGADDARADGLGLRDDRARGRPLVDMPDPIAG
jgi:hypothetical protein